MATRGSYVHNSMVKILGASRKMLVLCNFLKILMVSDKTIYKPCVELVELCKQNPVEKIVIFTHLPKLYIGFNDMWHYIRLPSIRVHCFMRSKWLNEEHVK